MVRHKTTVLFTSALLHQLLAARALQVPQFDIHDAPEAYHVSGEMDQLAVLVGGTEGAVYRGSASETNVSRPRFGRVRAGCEDVKTFEGFMDEAKRVGRHRLSMHRGDQGRVGGQLAKVRSLYVIHHECH